MNKEKRIELTKQALEARKKAYAPYSHFLVGAALLCKDGTIFTGCNIENSAYGPSNCAERTAIFKAVSEGQGDFDAICIVGGPRNEEEPSAFCPPCGVCRQVMAEFCEPDFEILLAKNEDAYEIHTLGELLPKSFSL